MRYTEFLQMVKTAAPGMAGNVNNYPDYGALQQHQSEPPMSGRAQLENMQRQAMPRQSSGLRLAGSTVGNSNVRLDAQTRNKIRNALSTPDMLQTPAPPPSEYTSPGKDKTQMYIPAKMTPQQLESIRQWLNKRRARPAGTPAGI